MWRKDAAGELAARLVKIGPTKMWELNVLGWGSVLLGVFAHVEVIPLAYLPVQPRDNTSLPL